MNFDHETADTSNIVEPAGNGAEWGIYWNDERRASWGEAMAGAFGSYRVTEGYKIDFYPYDMPREQFKKYINDYMR